MIKTIKTYNTHLILISVVLSITLGIYTPELFTKIKFLGDIFINLLKLFALPLIISTLIVTLGNMSGGGLGNLKSLARGTMSYMLLSEIIAVSIALILFNLFNAGKGVDPNLILQGAEYTANSETGLHLSNFLLAILPGNIFESLAKFDLLPIVIFSTMFGVGCMFIGEKAEPITKIAGAIRDVTNQCLHGVMLLSPIGIFALVGSGIAASNTAGNLENGFTALVAFVSILVIGLIIHGLWQLCFAVVITKQSPWQILKSSVTVFSTAFATSSSVTTLPVAIHTANKLKSKPAVTSFMLPLSASINVGGMMMYEVAAALFFSQILGVDLTFSQQVLIALASVLGGMAEGGIPETSLVSLVVVFRIVNIPLNAISILLPLDRIIDRFRTMVNIFGNMCGVIVVSHFLKGEQGD